MSIFTSCFLVFFLCLSLRLHLCNARRLGAVDITNKVEKKLHFSSKNDLKNGFKNDIEEEVKSKLGSIKEESMEKSQAMDDTQHKMDGNKKVKAGSGAVLTNKSAVSVSWRVPHRKRKEKHPVFNLDYSPPKTHPPSHN